MATNAVSGFPVLTPDEAAALISHDDLVGFSGFSAAGAPKAVPAAIARRADEYHRAGKEFQIKVLTGSSGGPTLDDVLAENDAVSWRCPYQSSKLARDRINSRHIQYLDMHISQVGQAISTGLFGQVRFAVVEATEITPDGRLYLTTSIGIVPSLLQHAEKVIIELNEAQHERLREMTDVFLIPDVPFRKPLGICSPLDRIGTNHARVDPAKIAGIVLTNQTDKTRDLAGSDETSKRIAGHVVDFLLAEIRKGRIPAELPPIQAGTGNLSNAVMAGFQSHPTFPNFSMYNALVTDSLVDLLRNGKLRGISTASLAPSRSHQQVIFDNMDFFAKRVVLRPSEVSNHPEIIRRLGVISLNTAIDFDIYGNVNATHFNGTTLMNGIGGGGDYAWNCMLAIFMTPSIRKEGKISSIVPMCPHVDHNEHAVHVVVTEQGVADLRGLDPQGRARRIIDCCAHPLYRDYLKSYLQSSGKGRIPHDLRRCYELYLNFFDRGSMLPET